MRNLVPAQQLERAATQQYHEMLAEARAQRALAPDNHPQLRRYAPSRSGSSRMPSRGTSVHAGGSGRST